MTAFRVSNGMRQFGLLSPSLCENANALLNVIFGSLKLRTVAWGARTKRGLQAYMGIFIYIPTP